MSSQFDEQNDILLTGFGKTGNASRFPQPDICNFSIFNKNRFLIGFSDQFITLTKAQVDRVNYLENLSIIHNHALNLGFQASEGKSERNKIKSKSLKGRHIVTLICNF